MLAELPGLGRGAALRQRRRQRPRVRAVLRAGRDRPRRRRPRRADRGDPPAARRSRSRHAVGSGDPDVVRAFSRELPRQHAPRPQRRARAARAAGRAAARARSSPATGGTRAARSTGALRLANGARWRQLPGSSCSPRSSTARRSQFFFADSVRTLDVPVALAEAASDDLPAQRAATDAPNDVQVVDVLRGGVLARARCTSTTASSTGRRAAHRPSRRGSTSTC